MIKKRTRLMITFYGDDFTGSTDSMEALALNGVRTVLFLKPPTQELIDERFPDVLGIGVAGVSRSMSPEEMEQELVPVFEALKVLSAPIVHYKICSTFDSSPQVGSIGKAIDIGAKVFNEQQVIPLLVGAPVLRRYTVFGHHYAGVGDHTYRLDRHPTMSRHPITPMDEADLSKHLAKQTNQTVGLMDMHDLDGDEDQIRKRWQFRLANNPDILLFDVIDEQRLMRAGALIWQAAQHNDRFVVGSSGVEYSLVAHWQHSGVAKKDMRLLNPRGRVEQILVVSGSCSPVTESQIKFALDYGFVGIAIDTVQLIDPQSADATRRELILQAIAIIDDGKSPLLYTAMGTEETSMEAVRQKLAECGMQPHDSGRLIGEQLGKLTREIVTERSLKRFVVAGGDTSGYVTRELQIFALETLMPLAPGGPLCKSYSDNSRFDGIELVLKGGQVGKEDYLVRVLEGK